MLRKRSEGLKCGAAEHSTDIGVCLSVLSRVNGRRGWSGRVLSLSAVPLFELDRRQLGGTEPRSRWAQRQSFATN